jgi:hypothetical protein
VVQQTLGHACSTVSEVDFDTTSDETSMSFSSQTSVREFRMNHLFAAQPQRRPPTCGPELPKVDFPSQTLNGEYFP